jgi:GNAT superfamily N-acetyltransferase
MFYTGVGKHTEIGMPFEIEQILHLVRSEIEPLRVASLGEGFSFLDRFASAWDEGKGRFQEPGESLWGAYCEEELVGICGLSRDPYDKNPEVGRLRHLYVLPVRRREGVGRALALTIIGMARERFRSLDLYTDQAMAAHFYERIGFLKVVGENRISHRITFQKNPASE